MLGGMCWCPEEEEGKGSKAGRWERALPCRSQQPSECVLLGPALEGLSDLGLLFM